MTITSIVCMPWASRNVVTGCQRQMNVVGRVWVSGSLIIRWMGLLKAVSTDALIFSVEVWHVNATLLY